jgi:hypothetical protein
MDETLDRLSGEQVEPSELDSRQYALFCPITDRRPVYAEQYRHLRNAQHLRSRDRW